MTSYNPLLNEIIFHLNDEQAFKSTLNSKSFVNSTFQVKCRFESFLAIQWKIFLTHPIQTNLIILLASALRCRSKKYFAPHFDSIWLFLRVEYCFVRFRRHITQAPKRATELVSGNKMGKSV